MGSRLSYRGATARNFLNLEKQRSTVLRSLQRPASKAGGRPPALPRARRRSLLVFLRRDDRLDPALAQVGAVDSGGVGLVSHRGAGPGTGPPQTPASDGDGIRQRDEPRAVAVLARAEDPADRAAAPVRGQVDLGAQPAAGPAQRLPARPGRQALVIRAPPPVSRSAAGAPPRAAGIGPHRPAGAPASWTCSSSRTVRCRRSARPRWYSRPTSWRFSRPVRIASTAAYWPAVPRCRAS